MHGLACPRCFAALDDLKCRACSVNYSKLGNVFWMWPEPVETLLDWRNRFNFHLAKVASEVTRARSAPSKLTQSRTQIFADHLDRYVEELHTILAPFNISEPLAPELHTALKTQLPTHHSLDAYNPNIFRDWVWGDEENVETCRLIKESVGTHITGTPSLLVLGAGAGRLTLDLHRAMSCATSWSLDSNPLLSSIAASMFFGNALELTEFPLAPRDDEAILHKLTAPESHQAQLHAVCGDAMCAPFLANTFDIVVTSWLVDVIDAPIQEMLKHVSSLLKPGGVWVMHGSLHFESADPNLRYKSSELGAIAEDIGFTVQMQANTELPYMQSPYSRQRRSELTHTMVCTIDRPLQERPRSVSWHPQWLNDVTLPVPMTDEFQTQITSTRVANFIMGLIDGKRSIDDMAGVMEAQRLMPKLDALEAIRNFLQKMQSERLEQQRRS